MDLALVLGAVLVLMLSISLHATMSSPEDQFRAPLLEKSHFRLLPIFSRARITVMVMATQAILCGFTWVFAGVMIGNRIIPLPDNVARWTHNNPSETNMLITATSTMLGMIGSWRDSLLAITVQHALISCLARGVYLSTVTGWIQLARNGLFFRPRQHLWWTLLSGLWVTVIGFLTTAWSNILTPKMVVRQFTKIGQEIDLLGPIISSYLSSTANVSSISPMARTYSLTPQNFVNIAQLFGVLTQAGRSAAMLSMNPGYPTFIGPYNVSTGGVLPAMGNIIKSPPLKFPALQENYKGLYTSYAISQQGYTADISCRMASSPTITLNNTASLEHTFETPTGAFNYSLDTWSWSTNCSGNGEYYVGEVNILTNNHGAYGGRVGNGLFATSVCFFQNFSGPSNQSFLVLMQSPNNSGYNESYFTSESNPSIVCEVTPMVTTVEVQYNDTGTANVGYLVDRRLPPDYSWPLASTQAFIIWSAYFLAQGPYSNSLADDPLDLAAIMTYPLPRDITPILERYLLGIFEYMATVLRTLISDGLSPAGQPLPDDMSIPINGTMNVQTVGWMLHPQTHGIALAVITIVALMTTAAGIFALLQDHRAEITGDTLAGESTAMFDPTNLMDFLVASSMGNLGDTLARPISEERRKNLIVELSLTEGGQNVLNVRGVTDAIDEDRKDKSTTLG